MASVVWSSAPSANELPKLAAAPVLDKYDDPRAPRASSNAFDSKRFENTADDAVWKSS